MDRAQERRSVIRCSLLHDLRPLARLTLFNALLKFLRTFGRLSPPDLSLCHVGLSRVHNGDRIVVRGMSLVGYFIGRRDQIGSRVLERLFQRRFGFALLRKEGQATARTPGDAHGFQRWKASTNGVRYAKAFLPRFGGLVIRVG